MEQVKYDIKIWCLCTPFFNQAPEKRGIGELINEKKNQVMEKRHENSMKQRINRMKIITSDVY